MLEENWNMWRLKIINFQLLVYAISFSFLSMIVEIQWIWVDRARQLKGEIYDKGRMGSLCFLGDCGE